MGRRKQEPSDAPPPVNPAVIGGNVTDEALKHFEKKYRAAKAKVDAARGELGALCKGAEDEGIDVKVFKQVQKLRDLLPPEASAKVDTFNRYTKQLGLFDDIEAFRQEEERQDNEASVRAAERKSKPMSKEARVDLDKSGGALEAAYAQGKEAGEMIRPREENPYPTQSDEHDAWDRGWAFISQRGEAHRPTAH